MNWNILVTSGTKIKWDSPLIGRKAFKVKWNSKICLNKGKPFPKAKYDIQAIANK